jgi:ACS family hexuronate transporter-like MFS transporter
MSQPLGGLAKKEVPPLASIAKPAVARGHAIAAPLGRVRWTICFVLFLAATINYVDRHVIALLKPLLARDFQVGDVAYAHVITAFQIAYALGMLAMGRVLDAIGTRRGFALAATIWGVAAMGHALVASALGFAMARLALGFGEAGMFPAAVKTIAEWFPRKERALATGLFNAGTTVGAIVTPLVVPPIVAASGPRVAFLLTGALALSWVALWLGVYAPAQEHPRVTARELEHIRSGPVEVSAPVPWRVLLGRRQLWAFAAGKLLTDPFWWLYLFWVPDFLHREHGLELGQMAVPLASIYLLSGAGSVAGGWLSSHLLARGFSVNRARKTAMLVFAALVAPIALAARAESPWTAALCIGLATAGHQGFSANLFTLASDLFPERAVGSAVGLGGMAGAVSGVILAEVVGRVLQRSGSYGVLFVLPPLAYVAAIGVIQLLSPRLEPLRSADLPAVERSPGSVGERS